MSSVKRDWLNSKQGKHRLKVRKCPNPKESLAWEQVSEAAWGWLSIELWTNALGRCDCKMLHIMTARRWPF